MLVYKMNWHCMDCRNDFEGNVDCDNDVILCAKCYKAFEEYVNEDSARSFTIFWWNEFIKLYGYRKEREEKLRPSLSDSFLFNIS